MKPRASHKSRIARPARAFTLVEMMVAMALGSVVMTAVVSLSVYSARTFASLGNYTDLDLHSRNALDVIIS